MLSLIHLGLATHYALLSDVSASASTSGSPVAGLIGLLLAVFEIVCLWKVFTKAGQPGWAAIVPIYNFIVLCRIAGKPAWWLLLFFIPFVNFVVFIMVFHGLSRAFGHGVGFTLGLIFLPPIFLALLAFGPSTPQSSGGYTIVGRAA